MPCRSATTVSILVGFLVAVYVAGCGETGSDTESPGSGGDASSDAAVGTGGSAGNGGASVPDSSPDTAPVDAPADGECVLASCQQEGAEICNPAPPLAACKDGGCDCECFV